MLKWTAQAVSFCRIVIDAKIAAGELFFSKASDVVLFYAGPEKEFVTHVRAKRKDPSFSPLLNWKLAAAEATRIGAGRIDDTKLSGYLMSPDFETELTGFVGDFFFKEAKKYVWDYVSERFAQTPVRKASTLVCGAGEESSFRVKELLGMLENPALEVVNERPVKLFQDFRALGTNEVFRLACMTKLIELRARAKASNDNDDKALYENPTGSRPVGHAIKKPPQGGLFNGVPYGIVSPLCGSPRLRPDSLFSCGRMHACAHLFEGLVVEPFLRL